MRIKLISQQTVYAHKYYFLTLEIIIANKTFYGHYYTVDSFSQANFGQTNIYV